MSDVVYHRSGGDAQFDDQSSWPDYEPRDSLGLQSLSAVQQSTSNGNYLALHVDVEAGINQPWNLIEGSNHILQDTGVAIHCGSSTERLFAEVSGISIWWRHVEPYFYLEQRGRRHIKM
jgi:hypothetical protein